MTYRWAALYLVACDLLGDESLAGEWLMQARTEAALAKRLEGLASLPSPLPEPTADVVELAEALRQRAQRRRRTAFTWRVAAAIGAVAGAVLLLAGPLSAPVAEQYRTAPVASLERGGLTLEVHEVEAGPDGLTVWWSLSGPNAGQNPSDVDVAVQTPTGIVRAGLHETTTRSARRDWLLGRTYFRDMLLPVRQEVALLFELSRQQWVLEVMPERHGLEAVEQRTTVNQVVSENGVGVLIKSVVTSPRYTVVEWEPWIAPEVAPSIRQRVGITRLQTGSAIMEPQGSQWARYTQFGPLPAQTDEVKLLSNSIMLERTNYLEAKPGAEDAYTTVRVERTEVKDGMATVELSAKSGGPDVTMILLEDGYGRTLWPETIVSRPAGNASDRPVLITARFTMGPMATPRTLHLVMLREAPPLAMTLTLQP